MEEIQYIAKPNCKSCLGRGFVIRTIPTGKKKMARNKTLCHCVTEIKKPEPDECVVPKVAKGLAEKVDDIVRYSNNTIAIPN